MILDLLIGLLLGLAFGFGFAFALAALYALQVARAICTPPQTRHDVHGADAGADAATSLDGANTQAATIIKAQEERIHELERDPGRATVAHLMSQPYLVPPSGTGTVLRRGVTSCGLCARFRRKTAELLGLVGRG